MNSNTIKKRHYILTETAQRDFREAKKWSMSRWGKALTKQYFSSLHQTAEQLGQRQNSFTKITDDTGLKVYPVREHYLVYLPLDKELIAIVSLIRQTRDVPAIIEANEFAIRRELKEIYEQFHSHTKQ
ncbi:MAG: plasmid stabilization system protein ParE [Phenylobacterium sp.]|jgi:plasmid stabilization system protein ParE